MAKVAQAKEEKGYKIGDFLAAPKTVILEVVAVVDTGAMPVYGFRSPKHNHIQWETSYQVEQDNMKKLTPDFKAYSKIKTGDILKIGGGSIEEGVYIRVLARVGDAVLLSEKPQAEKIKKVTKLAEQLSDLTDGELDIMQALDADDRETLRKMASTTHASKLANEWMYWGTICLMNWTLITGEE